MYDFYISNHLNSEGTSIISTEELMYSVPITDSDNAVKDPAISCEMGKNGSFEFSLSPVHPFYNRFQQMQTLMRVVYDGSQIFRGRVLTIDTNPLNGTRKIHLEGDLAFLMDSYQEGAEDADRPKTNIYTYLKSLINEHNEQMEDLGNSYKKFTLGEVPGHYSTASSDQRITVEDFKFGFSGWKKTSDAISELTKDYGGYFRTRREVVNGNEVIYLDWLETYLQPNVNAQPIKVSENMISLSNVSEVNNLFTVLIPIGSNSGGKKIYIDNYNEQYHGDNKSITVPQMAEYLTAVGRSSEMSKGFHSRDEYANAIERYGVIYKTQEFGEANTKEKLWGTAINWIRDNYFGGIVSFTATALDLHHLNPQSKQKYLVGERINVIYPDMSRRSGGVTPLENKTLVLTSVKYNPHNPDKNEYTIGIPSSLLDASGRYSKKKTKTDAKNHTDHTTTEEETQVAIDTLKETAEVYVISKEFNSDAYNRLVESDEDKANAAVKLTTALVYGIYKATKGELVWIKTTSYHQGVSDKGSIYKASNNTEWKIEQLYETQILISPVTEGASIPTSGTLTWVSGGYIHTKINYNSVEVTKDKRQWIYTADTADMVKGYRGSIYKASNNTQWELVTIQINQHKILICPLVHTSTLPSSGTLTWVSGGAGTAHIDIHYSKTESNIERTVSNIQTMAIEGTEGNIVLGRAIPDDGSYTDEEIDALNEFNRSVVIDAANSELSVLNPIELDASGQIATIPSVLASMKVNAATKLASVALWGAEKVTNPNAKPNATTSGNGVSAFIEAALGLDGTGDRTTIEMNGFESLTKYYKVEDADNPDATEMLAQYGDIGRTISVENWLGSDGTPDMATIYTSGKDVIMHMIGSENAGSTDPDDVTVEIKGNDDGEVGVGQKSNGHGGLKWTISLNKPVDYWVWEKDPQTGQQVEVKKTTAKNVVGSDDFHIPEVPSFKTKLAVMDQAIIGKADIADLNAVTAFINNLTSNTAKIDQISAKNIIGTAITSSQFTGPLTGGPISYSYYSQGSTHASGLFYDAAFSAAAGVVTLTFWKSDGSTQTINFNIADTQFYIDAISAAKTTGWNDSRSRIINSLPNSSSEQNVPNTNWTLKIPQSGYGSSDVDYPISVSNLTDYSYGGTTFKVYNVKIGSYIAYRKEVKLQNKGTVNPAASAQTITPDTGYDGIASITVGAAPPDRYETGWADAYRKVDWPDAQTSSATMTVIAPAATSTSTPNYQSVDYTVSADDDYAYIKQGAFVMAQATNPAYGNGWTACYNTLSYSGTTATKTLDYGEVATVTVTQKNSAGTTNTRLSRTYTAPADRYNDGWTACYNTFDYTGTTAGGTLAYGGSATVVVKQTTHAGQEVTRLTRTYTAPTDSNLVAGNIKDGVTIFGVTGTFADRYETGWADAYRKVDWPDAQTSSATMTVKAPAATSTSTPDYQSVDYTVSADDDYAYIKQGANTMAQVTNPAYKNGWTACYNTLSYSGTTATKTLDYGEVAKVVVKQKNSAGTNKTRLSRTYTAPADRYNDGWTGCYDTFDYTGTTDAGTLSYGGSATVVVKQTTHAGQEVTRLTRIYTAPTDSNLVAENIKDGVTIFGVTGTFADRYSTGWSDCYNTFDTTGTTAGGTLSYGGTASVVVKQKDSSGEVVSRLTRTYKAPTDSNLVAGNIKSGVTIFGVTGSLVANYETGWADAYRKVDWPDAQTSSATMTVKAPAATSTSTPNYQSVDYTVSADNFYAYIKQGENTMARVTNSAYADCYNSFDITGTDNTQTLSYGGSAKVSVKQTDRSGTVRTRLTRTYTAPTDANLVAGNIKSGVKIFNVTGTYSGGGSTPDYNVTFDGAGSCVTGQEDTVLAGYTKLKISNVPNSATSTYRYIKFKVDGKKRAFYFT